MVRASSTRARRAGVEQSNHWSRLQRASMVLPPDRCDIHAHRMVALCRRQPFLAYGFQLSDWVCQGKIPVGGGKKWGRHTSVGGVAHVEREKEHLREQGIDVTISTFATPPVLVPLSIAAMRLYKTHAMDYSCGAREGRADCCTRLANACNSRMFRLETTQ